MRNNVRELRGKAGLTQEAMGEQLGITRQSVISIEGGRYQPSLELAMKIAKLFETTVEKVFSLDDDRKSADAAADQ